MCKGLRVGDKIALQRADKFTKELLTIEIYLWILITVVNRKMVRKGAREKGIIVMVIKGI